LRKVGIATGIHYPVPLHLQPALAYLKQPKGGLPVTEHIAEEILSLPMYPELNQALVDRVADTIMKFAPFSADPSA